jgi:D-alanyl-lipoteichoic acid acyltransferase DltB (MBOAT superfamily)
VLFNSFAFLIFFPLVVGIAFLLRGRSRQAWLLVVSCLFYMWFVPAYILILAGTILVDWLAGLLIVRSQGSRRRWLLGLSLVANIGVLAVFKYAGFLTGNLEALSEFLHWNYSMPVLELLLPIGLSFHTFQSMSYVIEVYRGNQPAEKDLLRYSLYVMFFPQLVAGPIERPQNLLGQLAGEPAFVPSRISSGLRLMLWGLLKKMVIADCAAPLADQAFDHPGQGGGWTTVLGSLLFSVQIYCDFSGYSDIARGSARVLGYELMVNFRCPYLASSIPQFWQRWHISLSTWFRDYVYIPMGGNRVGRWRQAFNVLVVFALSGLWHGANWTFVVWGAIHGVLSAITLWWRNIPWSTVPQPWISAGLRPMAVLATFLLVTAAWIFFRAADFHSAWTMFSSLSQWSPGPGRALSGLIEAADIGRGKFNGVMLVIAGVMVAEWLHLHGRLMPVFLTRPRWQRLACYLLLGMVVSWLGTYGKRDFIYFQF